MTKCRWTVMGSGGGATSQQGKCCLAVFLSWLGKLNANLLCFCRDLGTPGQTVHLYGLNVFNGEDARGVTKQHFVAQKATGCYSMSWFTIAKWELV